MPLIWISGKMGIIMDMESMGNTGSTGMEGSISMDMESEKYIIFYYIKY